MPVVAAPATPRQLKHFLPTSAKSRKHPTCRLQCSQRYITHSCMSLSFIRPSLYGRGWHHLSSLWHKPRPYCRPTTLLLSYQSTRLLDRLHHKPFPILSAPHFLCLRIRLGGNRRTGHRSHHSFLEFIRLFRTYQTL